MATQTLTQTQQSASAPALPGTWKLQAGRAITLEPRDAGTLRVAHGQVWATYDGPHAGALNQMGDHILGVGQQLRLRAGQRLVLESSGGGVPAYFSWDPLPVAAVASVPRLSRLVQPLQDLRLALGLAVAALGRLGASVVGLAWDFVAGRDRERLVDCAFNAQSRACRAHGAMS
ncbi:MAG: DUF2917 domain-containing protein [Ramlibacter sp.]|nr:DUF2917 domain-containing protein [Ramlibacter sp.]